MLRSCVKSLLILFFVSSFLFPTQNANAATFGIRPAYPRDDNPRTQSIFVQTLNPNQEAKEGVRVINGGRETKNILIYASDSQKSSGGGFACGQLSDTKRGVGAWISFDLTNLEEDLGKVKHGQIRNTVEIEIPGDTEIIIPFIIQAPANASVGEHNGCILMQEIKNRSESSGVSLSLRNGIRVAIDIPGETKRGLELGEFNIEKRGGSIYLMPQIKNTGNVSIDANARVVVKYFFGKTHKVFGGGVPVLRDEIYDLNFELKKPLWGGLYSAKAIVAYDAGAGAGVGVSSGEDDVEIRSKNIWFWSFPKTIALVIEILVLLFLLFLFAIWRLNKKKKKWIKTWEPYTVKNGETLASLSQKFRLHWELIAEVNKIPPPFILKDGDVIKMPASKRK